MPQVKFDEVQGSLGTLVLKEASRKTLILVYQVYLALCSTYFPNFIRHESRKESIANDIRTNLLFGLHCIRNISGATIASQCQYLLTTFLLRKSITILSYVIHGAAWICKDIVLIELSLLSSIWLHIGKVFHSEKKSITLCQASFTFPRLCH